MPELSAPQFVRGQIYNRRRDIHAHFKGSQYGGIAPTKDYPFVFLFTGEAGEAYGYNDTWKDGLFLYSGEGQIGDQKMTNGNKAIFEHAETGKELLLFAKVGTGIVRFEGYFHCVGWEEQQGNDRNGQVRKLIVFHLKPEDGISEEPAEYRLPNIQTEQRSLEDLRRRAYDAAYKSGKKADSRESARTYYERSSSVRDYVLNRANGRCECCGADAPFKRKTGVPYLEAHHIHWTSPGSVDT